MGLKDKFETVIVRNWLWNNHEMSLKPVSMHHCIPSYRHRTALYYANEIEVYFVIIVWHHMALYYMLCIYCISLLV